MQAPSPPQPLQNNAAAAFESQSNHVDGNLARPRVVILGVGNIDNGDDAVGVLASRQLIDALAGLDDVRVIEAGLAPEGQTGPIRRFEAELVLIIDAAQMDEAPGTIRWLDWRETDGMSASTHTMPLFMLGKFLSMDIGCEVALLGIQPVHNVPGVPVSPEALAAVDAVVEGVVQILGS